MSEDGIDIRHNTDGVTGGPDANTKLPLDATKEDIEQAIREYV